MSCCVEICWWECSWLGVRRMLRDEGLQWLGVCRMLRDEGLQWLNVSYAT